MADVYVKRAEIAKQLHLTERRITELVKDGRLNDGTPFPSRVSGTFRTFPSEACFAWYLRFKQEEALQRAALGKPTQGLAEVELRKATADAELAESKLAERRRQLVDVAVATRETERLLSLVRTRVLSLRGRWQPRIIGLATMAEAALQMDALTDDVLASLRESADEIDTPDDTNEEAA